ncbi:MAG: methyltransferase domain-containing protein [Candidatus Methanoperedens sp.]|nr:methyltransferase domain-containing protein [Candidatus Methanoperedens sp.]
MNADLPALQTRTQRQDDRQFETNFSDRIYRINKMRIILSILLSCHKSEPERALEEVHRMLKLGGVLSFSDH